MRKRNLFFIAIFFFTFLLPPVPVLAEPGGYTVSPATTEEMINATPLETVRVEWWQVPPRVLLISYALMFCPLLVFPIEWFFLLKVFACLGYRKIAQKNVLENPTRNIVYSFIRKTPGTDLSEISRETKISQNTLRYHLAILKLTNKVTIIETSRNTRYFENSGRYSEMERKVLKYLHNRPTRILLQLLAANPNLTRGQLENAVGISGAGINWQMNRLSDDGLLVIRKTGRTARYELSTEVIPCLEKYLPHYHEEDLCQMESLKSSPVRE